MSEVTTVVDMADELTIRRWPSAEIRRRLRALYRKLMDDADAIWAVEDEYRTEMEAADEAYGMSEWPPEFVTKLAEMRARIERWKLAREMTYEYTLRLEHEIERRKELTK